MKKSNYFTLPARAAVDFGAAAAAESQSRRTSSQSFTKKKKKHDVTPQGKGSATKKTTRRKSPTGSKSGLLPKRARIEPGSLSSPENWESVYRLAEELRSDRTAPVDTDGPRELAETHLGPAVRSFQVQTALMLSSQTKDAVVSEAMVALQRHGLTPENIRDTDHESLNSLIRKVGFHNNKAKFMKQAAEIKISTYDGNIPRTADEIMALPGVGPKMAYIIEHVVFNTVSGIGVNTHMHRMFNHLEWVDSSTPEQTRQQLEGWLPRERWGEISLLWVGFGQELQQQKEKVLRKALACSSPKEALGLLQKLRLDVKKEARHFGLEDKVELAMNEAL